MDQWFYDHFFRLRGHRARHFSIVQVRINENRLLPLITQHRGQPVPLEDLSARTKLISQWHSATYHQLMERLSSAQPKLIVFTPYFDHVTEREQSALSRYPEPVFASLINEDGKLVPPSSALTINDNYGFSNIFPDPDNFVRKSPLIFSGNASLALRIYHRLVEKPIERNLVEPFHINYRGPKDTFPAVDAFEILSDNSERIDSIFRDKIVLVGKDESPNTYLETPFGKMPRLEIHANAIDSLLYGKTITIAPRWISLAVACLATTVAVVFIGLFPLTLAWLFLLVVSLLLVLLTLFTFSQFSIWPGIANPLVSIFATQLIMLGYKLTRQEEEQWRLKKESETFKEMDQFKNNFISLFSHDLKTPIAKIKAITDRLLTDHRDLRLEVREGLHELDRANGELARLISDILKVTKMETMSFQPNHDVLDLNRLIEQAVQRLKFLADEKKITLVQDLEPLFSMEGDAQLIQEVITNLIENAIKYSPSEKSVVIRTREEDGRVRITVQDEGMGIPADELPQVMGKFFRGKKAGEKTKGSGLGLYLSKYFVELHRGGLEIESTEGKGTTVSFWLPLPV